MSRLINTFKNTTLLINQENDVQIITLFDFSHSVLEIFSFFPTSAHLIKNIKRADSHS